MPLLKEILYKVTLKAVSGDVNSVMEGVSFDSRQVIKGSLFVAVSGTQTDGHLYIDKAVQSGATAIVCERLPEKLKDGVAYIETDDSAVALGIIAANFYGNPSKKIKVVAVTGTNGKTTSVTLLYQLFKKLGYKVGLLSTIKNLIDDSVIDATHTTPDAIQINNLLAEMVKAGCKYCFMEASSHAIHQKRISGIRLAGAIFTNISHDHLDYHKTFDDYIKAKKMIFDALPSSAFALTNADDKRGKVMLQNTKASRSTYGIRSIADFKAKILSNSLHGLELDVDGKVAWFKLIGAFNASNLMVAYATGCLLDQDSEDVLTVLSELDPAEGRFQTISVNPSITAIVDYAHTPDALENVLKTISEFRTGNEKVITVVGCGGDRDRSKRPLMAEIATRLSDKVILTSDNPRNEDPLTILKEMEVGVPKSMVRKTLTMPDRKEGIKAACAMAEEGDIILVAGKGHETYQDVGGVKYPFDDREVVEEMLKLYK